MFPNDPVIKAMMGHKPEYGKVPEKITANDMAAGTVHVKLEYDNPTKALEILVNGVSLPPEDFARKGEDCRELLVVFALLMEKTALEAEDYLKAAEAKKLLDVYRTDEKFEDYFMRKPDFDEDL